MCGITGFLEPPGRRDPAAFEPLVGAMCEAIRHRGPDDGASWHDAAAGIALGIRRLAILDLSPTGRQPRISPCGRYVLVMNGEIYNFRTLRAELEAKVYRFEGHSDTEVAAAAISEWGFAAALERFNGMFAFAVWDRAERRLELARDRFGQKPLYWGQVGASLVFGSELAVFWRFPGFAPDVDRDALTLMLRRTAIPAPFSIFRGIRKLPPGSRLTVRDGEVEERVWWSAAQIAEAGQGDPYPGNPEYAAQELDELLRDAVAISLASDVPIGAFLSGGIDSSTIVALMQQVSSEPVLTFTVGFAERRFDEAHKAGAIARHLGTCHSEIRVRQTDALALVPELPRIYDEPFADSSQIPTALLCRAARGHVTVALSGDGGDELFGGYANYRFLDRLRHLTRLPEPWVRLLAAGLRAGARPLALVDRRRAQQLARLGDFVLAARTVEAMYTRLVSGWKQPAELVLGAREPATLTTSPERWPRLASPVRRAMVVDTLTYLPDDVLVKVDRAAMAVGLETRIPLLDHRIFELLARLPLAWLYRGGEGKLLLRELLDRKVPRELTEHPKQGFSIPLDAWLRGELRPWAEALLEPERLRREGIFAREPILERWREHLGGRVDHGGYLWPVLMFQSWHEHWLGAGR